MNTRFSSQESFSPSNFKVAVEECAGGFTLHVTGELDLCSAPILADAVGGIELNGRRSVVLDLTKLRFCDASGVSAVLTAQRRISDAGGQFSVRAGSSRARLVFVLTGVDQVLDFD